MAFKLSDKVAIVYGGSYGIGKGICQVLANAGATIVVVARGKEKGEETVKSLHGGNHQFIQADVSKFTDHEDIIKKVTSSHGQIDIVVCCAGIYSPEYELDNKFFTEHYVDNMIDVNVKGSIYALKTALPLLKKSPSGRVILISSITGHITGMPGFTVYGATKSAQVGFARSAAVELAPHKITVNCVAPGNILTEGLKALGKEYINSMEKSIPLKRLGTPEDIGNTVLFLASSEASFITGQEIVVDGGQTRPESLIE